MTLEPFNLERALAGEPVCTRDGREVKQLTYFKESDELFPIYGILDGELHCWNTNGSFNNFPIFSKEDLFMKSKVVEAFFNVYLSDGQVWVGINNYLTLEDAVNNGRDNEYYIKTIRVTNEPT